VVGALPKKHLLGFCPNLKILPQPKKIPKIPKMRWGKILFVERTGALIAPLEWA
jgi:hypothetical protein